MFSGDYYTRVFTGLTPDDVFADWCGVWNSEGAMIAEGISHSTNNDNHVNAYDNPHIRRNAFGYTLNGVLYDLVGLCGNGMVKLHVVYREILPKDFPECLPDNCDTGKWLYKGPSLTCDE